MPEIHFLDADVDFDASITLTNADGTAATGLTVTGFVAAVIDTSVAVTIDNDLNITYAESGSIPGKYIGTVQGSAIKERLVLGVNGTSTVYRNKRVYLHRKVGQDWQRPLICRVRDGRAM